LLEAALGTGKVTMTEPVSACLDVGGLFESEALIPLNAACGNRCSSQRLLKPLVLSSLLGRWDRVKGTAEGTSTLPDGDSIAIEPRSFVPIYLGRDNT
jgi:hypothetical protein